MLPTLSFKVLSWLLLALSAGTAFAADGSASAPVRNLGVPDPLEVVRERLAQRLGVIKPSTKDNPNLVRVVSKASAPGSTASAAIPAARGDTPPATSRVLSHGTGVSRTPHAMTKKSSPSVSALLMLKSWKMRSKK